MARLDDPQTIPPGGAPPWKKWVQRQTWKLRNTARAKSRRTAPPSPAQIGIRKAIAYATELWHYLTPAEKASYPDTTASTYLKHQMKRWRDNHPPARAYPGDYTATEIEISALTLTAGQGLVNVKITVADPANLQAIIVNRSNEALAAPDRTTVIDFLRTTDATTYTLTDSPLDQGTYHYRAALVEADGRLGPYYPDQQLTLQ